MAQFFFLQCPSSRSGNERLSRKRAARYIQMIFVVFVVVFVVVVVVVAGEYEEKSTSLLIGLS